MRKRFEHQSDSEIVPDITKRLTGKYLLYSWSFDKGYWNKRNKELLSECVEILVLPKKASAIIKKNKNKVRLSINDLETSTVQSNQTSTN